MIDSPRPFYINNRQANEIMGVDRGMPVNGIMVDAVWDQLSADDRESIAYVREMVEPASSTINPPSPAKAVKVNAAIMPGIQEQLLYRRGGWQNSASAVNIVT